MQNQSKMLFVSGLLLALAPVAFAQTAEPALVKPAPEAEKSPNVLIDGDFEDAANGGEGWTGMKGNGVSI